MYMYADFFVKVQLAFCVFVLSPITCIVDPETHHLLPHLNPDWFYLSGTGLPTLSSKRRR